MSRTNNHVYGERALWVKGEEAKRVRSHTLSVIIREGDRSDPAVTPLQWLPLFQPIPVYFIEKSGDSSTGALPVFRPDDGTAVEVAGRLVTRIGDLVDTDLLFGDGAVPKTVLEVIEYFETEMSPGRRFGPETVVTVYRVHYLKNEPSAAD